MRMLCNSCKRWKNIRKDNYKKMLERFSLARSMLYGMTVGLRYTLTNPRRIVKDLSNQEMLEAFEKNYICRECKNNKKQNIEATKRISQILNLKEDSNVRDNMETK